MDQAIASIVHAVDLVLPEAVLVGAACALFLGAAFYRNRHAGAAVALGAVAGAVAVWWTIGPAVQPAAGELGDLGGSPFRHDFFAWFIKGVSLAAGVVFILFSWNQTTQRHAAEYHACLLVILAGVNLVAAANDLVTLFLALELISIPTYVLLYLPRQDAQSQEAATKYFLLSVFSSGLLLYGFSFIYGAFGSTNLEVIRNGLLAAGRGTIPGTLLIALVMVVAGLGFRITAVPFHFYAPDVFQGTPTVGAALLAFIPKVAGFVALLRLVTATLLAQSNAHDPLAGQAAAWTLGEQARLLFWILAAVTMFIGNFLALLQDNVKRMLAYSSIAHAGYMLIGLGVGPTSGTAVGGIEALLFYLVVYGAMTVGAFAVLAYLSRPERSVETVDDLAGVGWTHPAIGLLMTLFLFSLIGLPPTAGFWGKFYLFFAAWSAPTAGDLYTILAILLAINAAIGAWYYLRLVAAMYLRQPVHPLEPRRDVPALASLLLCGVVTAGLFVWPGSLSRVVREAKVVPAAVGVER